MKNIKKLIKIWAGITSIVSVASGWMFYTKEYGGENNQPGWIKSILDKELNIKCSLLMAIIITYIFISVILAIWAILVNKYEKRIKEEAEKIRNEVVNKNNLDKAVFYRIKKLLPMQQMIAFLKNLDMGNDIIDTYINLLTDYMREWEDPTLKFEDEELETLRKELNRQLKQLDNDLSENTERKPLHEVYYVAKEIKNEDFSKYNSIIKKLNKCSSDAWEIYARLINECRTKLGEE